MAERSGKPTLFRRDEFGGFYEGLNKLEHQAGGKQVLIAFHDGRNYRKELVGQKQKDKKTGKTGRKPEIIEVKDPFLSILAGTQHDLLLSQAQAGDIFSGFLPRFAFIVPEGPRQRGTSWSWTFTWSRSGTRWLANYGTSAACQLAAFTWTRECCNGGTSTPPIWKRRPKPRPWPPWLGQCSTVWGIWP